MIPTITKTQDMIEQYVDELLNHEDYSRFFSDDVVAVLEGITPERHLGRDAVKQWIDGFHALGTIESRPALFSCDDHAAGEFEFVRKDGVRVPYTATYDIANGEITALRLLMTGPVV